MTSETVEVAHVALRLPRFWKSTFVYGLRNATMHSHSVVSPVMILSILLWLRTWMLKLSPTCRTLCSPLRTVTNITLSRSGSSPNLATRRLKIKKLLTDLQLGDEKPSHLLRKMKEMSNGQLQDDFLQSLWLQKNATTYPDCLSASSEPLDKLAIIADKVSEVVGSSSTICAATTVSPPSQSSSCSVQPTMDSLARQIQELSLRVAELTKKAPIPRHQRYSSDRRRSHSRSRVSIEESGICYYHRRYKEQARKCVSPCAFVQKNEPSKSPWSSPLHVVPKSDSTVRPVGDYRQLNSVTEFDSYPMPYLNDFAHALHGKKIFSKIDIFKAFHQIPIAECDIPKTAVTTPWGLYEYTHLFLALQKVSKCSPRQIRQLDFISQFTTNIVHIPGSDNIAADILSRVSAITFPSQIDYDCIAETQQGLIRGFTLIASGTSLELKKDLQLPPNQNETPATVEPNATASTPATVESDQQLQRLPSHLHVLVAKFIFHLGIVDTGREYAATLQLNITTQN
ncbi:hypothetical protein TNCV_3349711 [Trichonephila clavipes]|nr:hypothetical protein TNCV_3349711 [Trichonephila clavipes]